MTSEFVECKLMSFCRLACAGTTASVSGDIGVLSIKNGIHFSLPSCQCDLIEQYNVFELICESGFYSSLSLLAHSSYQEMDWNRWESSWYPYDFDAGSASVVKATVKQN